MSDHLLDARHLANADTRPRRIKQRRDPLRDRYYLGYVTYDGQEFQGRHDPLIDEDLFDQVQTIAEARSAADERRRVHHHYLKGSLFCGRCERIGVTKRMIIQHTVNSRGYEYTYFFCRNKQTGTCTAPHVNVLRVEAAIEAHYATVRFTPEFIAEVRAHVAEAVADQEAASRLLHRQLTAELRTLDAKDDNLIDLVATADDNVPKAKAKIHAKLNDIERQRRRLTERLSETNDELTDSARLIEVCLKLLHDPQELYRRCDDDQRRLLNQALFEALYIEEDQITGHRLKKPFAYPHAAQARHHGRSDKPDPGRAASHAKNAGRAVSQMGNGPTAITGLEALLADMDLVHCSSKQSRVGVVEALAHPARPAKRLMDIGRKWSDNPTNWIYGSNTYRTIRQLRPAEVDQLVAAFEAGSTAKALAAQFGVHRVTIGQHLRARGIDTKPPGLAPDDVPAAAALYRVGWSLARIGEKFGTTDDTVRARLLEMGVVMRGPHERVH